jgi:hypothetical protein
MGIEQNGLAFHRRNANSDDRRYCDVDSDSFSAGQLAYALTRLRTALAAVDGLLANASSGPSSECNAYQLGEASHDMHYALLMLSECANPIGATGVTGGFR